MNSGLASVLSELRLLRIKLQVAVGFALAASATSVLAVPPSQQVMLVTELYQKFSSEAVLEAPHVENESFLEQSRNVLLRFFDAKLVALIFRDRECVAATHEICRLDFMPLWGNQDPIGAAVRIEPGTDTDTVTVHIRYPSGTTQMVYYLMQTNNGWRIRDISYGPGRATLTDVLEARH